MSQQKFASDYIDVATRLVEFRDKYPNGSLQPADLSQPYRIETIGDTTWIVVVSAAYRTPDDPRPGIGMAYEQFPGGSPFTRNSELQNAETSAWGRAIVAALAADTRKGIASAEEVRNRRSEEEARAVPPVGRAKLTRSKPKAPVDDEWTTDPLVAAKRDVWHLAHDELGMDKDGLSAFYAKEYGGDLSAATVEDLTAFLFTLRDTVKAQAEAPV